jgi:hypothetical protein
LGPILNSNGGLVIEEIMHSLHIYMIDDIPNALKKIRKEKKVSLNLNFVIRYGSLTVV